MKRLGRGLDALLGDPPRSLLPTSVVDRAALRKMPKALNAAEETFALHLRGERFRVYQLGAEGTPPYTEADDCLRQWPVCGSRNWRLDFAFSSHRVAIEVEGAPHRIKERWKAGLERQRFEAALGWRVFRFTPQQVISGQAILFVRALRAAGWDTTDAAVLAALED